MFRFFLALLILAAIVVVVAVYRDWLRVGLTNREGATDVRLTVDRDKFLKDVNYFTDGNQSQTAREIKGQLASVEPDQNRMTIQNSEGSLTVSVTANTQIRVGANDGTLADLRPGMQVAVTYISQDNRHVAQRITAESPAKVKA